MALKIKNKKLFQEMEEEKKKEFDIVDENAKYEIGSCINDKLGDVVREIHMSYMTKEHLIKEINAKDPSLNKTALNNFFKDNALKINEGDKVKFNNPG
jgi:hypothetical protein